jgi:ABC-2 type transport system ATP-binding protein
LIDAPDRIVDAVPRGGRVWFIRQPDCDEAALRALPDTAFEPRVEELEDAFMACCANMTAMGARLPSAPAVTVAESKGWTPGHRRARSRPPLRRFHGRCQHVVLGRAGKSSACSAQRRGQTTTFRMLCGLLPATSGHLEVAGLNLRKARAEARRRIGYVSQKFALYDNLTVRKTSSSLPEPELSRKRAMPGSRRSSSSSTSNRAR